MKNMTKRLRFKDIQYINIHHQFNGAFVLCLYLECKEHLKRQGTLMNALKKVIGIKTKNICSNFFPKSVGLFSQLFEQNFPGILCMTNGDMSGHVQWTCGSEMHTAALTIILFLVHTQGTCSKNAEQRHTTGTKSWHLHKQENVAHRRKCIPLISCSDTSPFVP